MGGAMSAFCMSAFCIRTYGLHAKDDLARSSAASPAACCWFCAKTPGCVAWTLNLQDTVEATACRAKGAAALQNSSRVLCEGCVFGFLHIAPAPPPPPRPANLRNILFIVVDDLRPQMNVYGQSETVTPHLDAFALGALVFDRAYCQQARAYPSHSPLTVHVRL